MSSCVIPITSLLLLVFLSSNVSLIVPPHNEDGSRSAAKVKSGHQTCTSQVCYDYAQNLLDSMDTSVDPCQDFYQFACGNWVEKNPRPNKQLSWKIIDILKRDINDKIINILSSKTTETKYHDPLKHAQDFYASCMNKEKREKHGVKPLVELLNSFGGWPMTMMTWNPEKFDWQKTIAYITRTFESGIILDIGNKAEKKNSSSQIRIHIDQSDFILHRDTYIDQEKEEESIYAYKRFIIETAFEIKETVLSSILDSERRRSRERKVIETDIKNLLKFEQELAQIASSDENRTDKSRMYNPFTLTQLQTFTDDIQTNEPHAKINWLELLQNIYKPGANIDIKESETVIVMEVDYLKKLVALLNVTPLRTIANYVLLRLVYLLASTTNRMMESFNSLFRSNILGETSAISLNEDKCIKMAVNHYGFVISNAFLNSINFNATTKAEVETMVTNLKAQFADYMDKADWMDSIAKEKAKEKLNHMSSYIGYPDWIMDPSKFQNYYSGLSTSSKRYFETYKSTSEFSNTKHFKKLREPIDPQNEAGKFPYELLAGYLSTFNSLIVTAAYLQYPFFVPGVPAALNYGAIGFVIAHEITHGFDTAGIERNKDGNLESWLKPETKSKFDERAKCFVDQYNEYSIPDGTHVDGQISQDENIADGGGVRQAFRAYKALNIVEQKLPGLKKYTREQLFFISLANSMCSTTMNFFIKFQIRQTHLPEKFRVNGALSNNEYFVQHFNCPAWSVMNKEEKCILW